MCGSHIVTTPTLLLPVTSLERGVFTCAQAVCVEMLTAFLVIRKLSTADTITISMFYKLYMYESYDKGND